MKKLDIREIDCKEGKFFVLKNDTGVGNALRVNKQYQPVVLNPALKHIKPGDTILDVGANIGPLTIPFAKAVGDEGVVHAFEPQRIIFQQLCANIILNGLPNVQAYNIGISDSNKIVKFGYKGKTSKPFKPSNFGSYAISNSGDGYETEVRTLDSFNIPNISFIKIDIEGHELKCLHGAVEIIKEYKPVIILESNQISQKQKETHKEIIKFMDKFKYSMTPLVRASGKARDFLFV